MQFLDYKTEKYSIKDTFTIYFLIPSLNMKRIGFKMLFP